MAEPREIELLRKVFLKAEVDIINEIARLRTRGLIDYHAVSALERVQAILRQLEDDAWKYIPRMIQKQFYVSHPELYTRSVKSVSEHFMGYINASDLTADQWAIVDRLTSNLTFTIHQACNTTLESLNRMLFPDFGIGVIGRLEDDIFRGVGLLQVAQASAKGNPLNVAPRFVEQLRQNGLTAFVDKAGRKWSLANYAIMVCRTTSRQAEVLSVLTADPEHDLYKISAHGTTCPLCAPFEGRVYSRSGTSKYYPPLSDAFGKVDKSGSDALSNSWLNIHPNCLVPGGTVLAEGVKAHTSREYHGSVITLETASGNRITVTPNHPVLTASGFIPAADLHEGQEIIEASGEYGTFIGEAPDNINIPTMVEDICHSVIQPLGGSTVSVEGSTEQFHGDGITDSKVDIVFTDSFIESVIDSLSCEPLGEPQLPPAHFRRPFFFTVSTLFKIIKSTAHSLDSGMRSSGFSGCIEADTVKGEQSSDVRRGFSGLSRYVRVGHSLIVKAKELLKFFCSRFNVTWRHIKEVLFRFGGKQSVINHSSFDGIGSYSEMLSNLRVREPLAAQRLQDLFSNDVLVVSKLIHVDTSQYDGLVYNLETKCGFYTYNSIITHNCLHVLTPWSEKGHSEAEIKQAREFSSPRTNPYSYDPRTKAQIDAYRNKEKGRQQLLSAWHQYEDFQMVGIGPKTFETFLKHKIAGDDKYKAWLSEFKTI